MPSIWAAIPRNTLAKRSASVADEDLPTTAKKKYDRLTKKADRISARNKKSPAKFASAAQRKAVWASKNEKKENK